MDHRAICFAIMPFGRKPDATGRMVDFDRIYMEIVAPAVADAGLNCIRADEEQGAGFIHKLMYERILLSEFAIADLTIQNANVYYELGIRHATRPATTVLTMAAGTPLPFDVGPLRAMNYTLDDAGLPADAAEARRQLGGKLAECKARRDTDSPLFQLLEGYNAPPVDHTKTDVFREKVVYTQALKAKLQEARSAGIPALNSLRDELGKIDATEAGVAVDLLLSYRAVSHWEGMIEVVEAMDPALARTQLVREQHAFALNRAGQDEKAEHVLIQLIEERGPSSETCGLLGRIYKDRWRRARKRGLRTARVHLRKAIQAYMRGFETDWRDAFPGVNALTLMSIEDVRNPAIAELAPVVRYAAKRRLSGKPDYWDYASLAEIAVNTGDWQEASAWLDEALALPVLRTETWMSETTARNFRDILQAREESGLPYHPLMELVSLLEKSGHP